METHEITLRDAARESGRALPTLRSWYKDGLLKGRKSGSSQQGAIIIDKVSLAECLKSHSPRKVPDKLAVREATSSNGAEPQPKPLTANPEVIAVAPPSVEEKPSAEQPPTGRKKKPSRRKRLIQRAKGALRLLDPSDLIKLRNWTQNRLDQRLVHGNAIILENSEKKLEAPIPTL